MKKNHLWRLIVPYWLSKERWIAGAMAVFIVGFSFVAAWISIQQNDLYGTFMNALQKRDANLLWKTMLPMLVFMGVPAILYVIDRFLICWLQLRWRRYLVDHLIGRWLSRKAYYRMERDAISDNPDQRIAEDVKSFIEISMNLTLGFVASMASLGSYSYLTWTKGGDLDTTWWGISIHIPGYMLWFAILYALLDWALTHYSGRRLLPIGVINEAVEADFRYALIQVRDNAEQIAMYSGEGTERHGLGERFKAIWAISKQRFIVSSQLGFFTSVTSRFTMTAPLLVMAPRYLAGEMDLGTMMATSSAWMAASAGFGWFANNYGQIVTWRTVVRRLRQLNEAIDLAPPEGIALSREGSATLVADQLTLGEPGGKTMTAVGSFEVARGQRWMITGRSGTGKSTLLRAIAGLWPHGSGRLSLPAQARTLFLPQKNYIPAGTLKAALAYPAVDSTYPDSVCEEVLEACCLPGLVTRLHESAAWSRSLSLGEQQRLAFARVLLSKPDFLFLDEATSALDFATEQVLHQTLLARLPDITLVSVAHRESLRVFHTHHLHLVPT